MELLDVISVVGAIVGVIAALGFKPSRDIRNIFVPMILGLSSSHLVFNFVVSPIAKEQGWPDDTVPYVWWITASVCFGIATWIMDRKVVEEWTDENPSIPIPRLFIGRPLMIHINTALLYIGFWILFFKFIGYLMSFI